LTNSNPQNPTGASIPKSQLDAIVDIAQRRSIIIHCDEVYRPIFHSISPTDSEFPPSVLTFGYEHTIVTGSMSKAYGLAGIRLGWMASRSQSLIDTCAAARDYTTISVSQLDDSVAAFALAPHCVHNLLQRNIDLAKRNIAILEKFIDTHRWACEWVKPQAGTTAFVKFTKMGRPVDDVAFCKLLIEKTGILLVPGGECFARDGDFKGYIRIGFCCETDVLEAGLKKLSEFLKEHLEAIPLASQTTLEIR
jgi:aspartate/methionine/tyrosine aminotransferase